MNSVENKSRTYIEYFNGKGFAEEREVKEVTERDISSALENMPPYCFGFRFYDLNWKITTNENNQRIPFDYKRINESGTYYPGGQIFSYKFLKYSNLRERILLEKLKENNQKYVIKDRNGNFHYYQKHDKIVEEKTTIYNF